MCSICDRIWFKSSDTKTFLDDTRTLYSAEIKKFVKTLLSNNSRDTIPHHNNYPHSVMKVNPERMKRIELMSEVPEVVLPSRLCSSTERVRRLRERRRLQPKRVPLRQIGSR